MGCRVCDATDLEIAIDLGDQPLAHIFLPSEKIGKEKSYPLQVSFCHSCHTAQLANSLQKELIFSDHTYLSGVTQTLNEHFQSLAKEVDSGFFSDTKSKRALDIGSNDGAQLQAYQKLGYDVLGVEAAKKISDIANERGIRTLPAFFNLETAKTLDPFDVINASGVFFHLEELHSVTEGIKHLLKGDGVFVVQFLYMKSILENGAFDQIYHEHLLYYTLKTVNTLLKQHGLELFDAKLSSIHGGSIIGFVGHQNTRSLSSRLKELRQKEEHSECNTLNAYKQLEKKVAESKKKTIAYLDKKKKEGKTIYGMGAPVKGNTFLNSLKIGSKWLDCLVEKNPYRKGLFSPGMHLPVVLENELSHPPDVYLVLAWNFKKEILKNNQHLIDQGVEFYFAIP